MRSSWRVVVVVIAAACGGHAKPPPPEPLSNTVPPPPRAAPASSAPRAAALPCDTDLVRRTYAFATGVPECDQYLHVFAALICCPKVGPALDGLQEGLEATLQSWDSWKDIPPDAFAAARKAAAPGCAAGTDALRNTAQSLECTLP